MNKRKILQRPEIMISEFYYNVVNLNNKSFLISSFFGGGDYKMNIHKKISFDEVPRNWSTQFIYKRSSFNNELGSDSRNRVKIK